MIYIIKRMLNILWGFSYKYNKAFILKILCFFPFMLNRIVQKIDYHKVEDLENIGKVIGSETENYSQPALPIHLSGNQLLQIKNKVIFPIAKVISINNIEIITHIGLIRNNRSVFFWNQYGVNINSIVQKINRRFPIFLCPRRDISYDVICLSHLHIGNYGHFLIEVLTQLEVFCCLNVQFPEKIIVCGERRGWQIKLLECYGFTEENIEFIGGEVNLYVNRLLIASPIGVSFKEFNFSWIKRFDHLTCFRNRLIKRFSCRFASNAKSAKKIYISRKNYKRSIVNENELIEFLSKSGFMVVDPGEMALEEQIRLFVEANAIIGPYGAAYTNLIFADLDCKMVEIYPKNINDLFYFELASIFSLSFDRIEGGDVVDNQFFVNIDLVKDWVICNRLLES